MSEKTRFPFQPASFSIDILFTLLTFYGFIQWSEMATFSSRFLGIGTLLVIVNEVFSSRATYDFYSDPMYILDLVDVFLFVNIFHMLRTDVQGLGYDPTFWILIALVWLVYAVWDFFVIPYTQDTESRASLMRWEKFMLFAFLGTLVSYIVLVVVPSVLSDVSIVRNVNTIFTILPSCLIFGIIIGWNRKKLLTIRTAIENALQRYTNI